MWYKTPSSPATARASATLIRGGTGASTQRAKAGSHSDTGRGSSSMTLYVPGSAVIAATVAATASSIWPNDQTPEPSPMIVDRLGKPPCRERVDQSVLLRGATGTLKKKKKPK